MDEETWREMLFHLCWKQHGGSGLGFSPKEALDLDFDEFIWFVERIEEQRELEARELEKASG
ncbi:MAG: hypothetical protein GY854_13910 [Deltaproteobacteria bacterium]|nr:hypothetical protein [Deltaproteobacteria bacterium]